MNTISPLAPPEPQLADRRRFLRDATVLGFAATPLLTGLANASRSSDSWKPQLSTSTLHYRSLSLAEACRRIGELGFPAVDVWSHFEWAGPLCEHLEEGLEQLGPAGFEALLKRHDLRLFSASCYRRPLRRYAAGLRKMGGCVVIRGSRKAEGNPLELSLEQLRGQLTSFLAEIRSEVELAAECSCTLAIENHSGASLLNSLDSMKLFCELNQHPNLGIALAPYHIQRNDESVEEAIRVAGKQLKFFYAWQHGEGTDQLPGIGPTDMESWLEALAGIGYDGYVNPFMHHEPAPDEMDRALATSRDYLWRIAGN